MSLRAIALVAVGSWVLGCGPGSRNEQMATAAESGADDDDGDGDTSGPIVDDIPGISDLPNPGGLCKVIGDELDAIPDCEMQAPPGSFEPDIQWTWTGGEAAQNVVITPLVGNLTDDNGDGEIDLCDTPDVVVVACQDILQKGRIFILDGLTGEPHFDIVWDVNCNTNPAIGDIDGDGVMEIVTSQLELGPDGLGGRLIAFENDGTLKWMGDLWEFGSHISAVALADLDGDGGVEIVAGNNVYDHEGNRQWTADIEPFGHSATVPVDLDGDGDLEVLLGNAAYHHDGAPYFEHPLMAPGFPQVADLDGDGLPEIVLTHQTGITVLAHDGTIIRENMTPPELPPGAPLKWTRPAALHDMDGDGLPEIAVSSDELFAVYEADGTTVWSYPVDDGSGVAAGTAFDFLGDGSAEAMYADEQDMFVLGEGGSLLMQIPRRSATGIEYPVVADIDNDGSAEIVVVSNVGMGMPGYHAVQAIRDVDDRWIQARRIWNQHAYSVTNVREDGTIPPQQAPNWASHNTYRTNSQIEGGLECVPVG